MALVCFFLLGLFWFWSGLLFSFMLVFYLFVGLNVFSWGGMMIFFDSSIYLLLVFMMIFILGLIIMSESSSVLVFLSEVLVLVCLFFFFSVNMLMMYIFFELSIFPILVMIMGYGSQVEKIGASYYLIFYAVMCSTPFLYVYFCSNFFLVFVYYDLVLSWEMLIFLTVCFLVKFPVYFLHLWLPKAHVEAPTTASMLLAGLLLKLGTVGYLRLMVLYNSTYIFFWVVLALLGMIVGSLLCLLQSDVKSVVAYSSIVHMGFVFLVLVIVMSGSKISALLMMVSHGYISTMMFFLVGEFFHVFGSRMLSYYSGFMVSSLLVSYMMMMVFLCNGGLPPSLSFFSEFVGFVYIYLCYKGLFIFLMLYFFVAFYFSVFVLTSSLMGKNYINFFFLSVLFIMPGIFLMLDFFFLGVLM